MKTGGLYNAVRVNAIAEAAGIVGQIGTMVESSIASAAGLHFAMAHANVKTVEMGGPLMIAGDIGNLRALRQEPDQAARCAGPGRGTGCRGDRGARRATHSDYRVTTTAESQRT